MASSTWWLFAGPTPGFYERTDDEGWEPFRAVHVAAQHRLGRSEPAVRRPGRRWPRRRPDHRARCLHLAPVPGGRGLRPGPKRPPAAGRGTRPAAGLRRRHAVHLPRRHVRRRPHRPRAHPQRRGLLLAEPGLRPLRRQGHHGQRAVVRPPRSVRPAPHPPGRHRRLGHQRHHLPGPRRRASLLQPVGQPLERSAPPGPVPARRQRLLGHDGRPAGQRHRLPGLVVAPAWRCAPAAALHRPDGRDTSRTC